MHAGERASILAELNPPYTLLRPDEQLAPVVFCSPHSGRIYPKAFLQASRLDPHTLRKSEDCYVDELFEAVVALGAPLIAARFPRAYLDVNREPYELDPELFTGRRARVRQHPVGPRGGRARHHRPHRRRHRGDLSRATADRRRFRAHRAALSALPRRACRSAGGDPQAFRHRLPDRLPLHAVGLHGPDPRWAPAFRAGRPVRRVLRCAGSPASCATSCRAPATRCSSTAPMPAASSPSTTATRRAACSPCSSRSIAGSISTRSSLTKGKDFAKLTRVIQDMAVRVFAALPLLLERRAAAE